MMRLICLFCLVFGAAGNQAGSKLSLSYDAQSKELTLRCPEQPLRDNAKLTSVTVRQKSGNGAFTNLAGWLKMGNKIIIENPRARVVGEPQGASGGKLEVILDHVTCYDAVEYDCYINYWKDGSLNMIENQHFDFVGEITQPYIMQDPLKPCYAVNDILSLNCSARIGTADNEIIWEAGFPGSAFSPVTEVTERTVTFGERQETDKNCVLHSQYSLKYVLKESDNGKVFRCRLNRTMHKDQVIVNVACGDKGCVPDTKAGDVISVSEPSDQPEMDVPRTGQVKGQNSEESNTDTNTTMLILITVIPCVAAIFVISLAVLIRLMRNRQMRPLVVMDTPAPSEYSCSDRRLPELPNLHQKINHDNTTPKWLSTHYPNSPSTPNTSIYVSMTNLDGNAGDQLPAQTKLPGEDGFEPLMRTDRSESIYSNQTSDMEEAATACAESRARGMGADSHCP